MNEPLDLDPAPVTRVFEGRIDADAVAAFAAATNDRNPRYEEGSAVPPLFTGGLILGAQIEAHAVARPLGIRGSTGGVHGEHDVYFVRPCRPGMDLRWAGVTESAHQTKAGVVLSHRIVVSDETDEPLVEHIWSNFFPSGRIDADFGPPLPDHSFPEAARERLLASTAVKVDRDQGFRYAGVSGDHIGHSMDDVAARQEGYPGKILQGMCTFSMASGALVDMVAEGDPDRLGRLAVRFSAPTFPRRDLVVLVYDAGRAEHGGRMFAFEAEQDGAVVLKHGRVELRP